MCLQNGRSSINSKKPSGMNRIKQIGIINSVKIDDKNKLMQEQCGKEEILPKEEIRTIEL